MAYWFSRGLLILAVAVFLGAALWKLPQYQVGRSTGLTPENQFNRENEARKTLAQILGGLALLFGLYLTWRRITAAEKTAEATLKSAETALQNVRVAQDSQITERFTRAIGQLGHGKLEIRLGGIYALERIARDSEMDHWPVMEVLTAYVRENAPWKENSSPSKQDGAPNPRTDVQAILTVLGRRQRSYEKEGQILDLRKTNLRTAYLEEVHLEKAVPPRSPPRKGVPPQSLPRKGETQRSTPRRREPQRSPPGKGGPPRSPPGKGETQRSTPRRREPQRSPPGKGGPPRSPPGKGDPRRSPPGRREPHRSPPARRGPPQSLPGKGDPRRRPPGKGVPRRSPPDPGAN